MDDPVPARRVFITIGGDRIMLVPTDKLLGPELREVKRISGMALVPMEHGLQEADWDCWFAWIYVSMRRTRPTLTEAELEHLIGDTPPVAIIGTAEEDAPEVAVPDDPLSMTHPNGDGGQSNGSGSGETIPPPSTSATAGHLTSETQT